MHIATAEVFSGDTVEGKSVEPCTSQLDFGVAFALLLLLYIFCCRLVFGAIFL
jgi:hypothetical protein